MLPVYMASEFVEIFCCSSAKIILLDLKRLINFVVICLGVWDLNLALEEQDLEHVLFL